MNFARIPLPMQKLSINLYNYYHPGFLSGQYGVGVFVPRYVLPGGQASPISDTVTKSNKVVNVELAD